MGRHTTVEVRELVIYHFIKGKSQRKIAAIVNLASSTVHHIIERLLHENRVQNKGRKASSKILSASDERWVLRKIQENPRLSAQKLASEVENYIGKRCSVSTIRRLLCAHDFHGWVPTKNLYINKKKNQISRLKFCNNHKSKDL